MEGEEKEGEERRDTRSCGSSNSFNRGPSREYGSCAGIAIGAISSFGTQESR